MIILKTDEKKYDPPKEYFGLVDIHYLENGHDRTLTTHDYLVKNCDCDWILSIDNDELLVLNPFFENIKHYVKSIKYKYPRVNAFYFRWGMIEKYDIDNINENNYFEFIYKLSTKQINNKLFIK